MTAPAAPALNGPVPYLRLPLSAAQRTITTGQSIFAEGLSLCRGQIIGHSAKSLCRGPDPRQRTTLGKDSLPRARQAHGNNNYLPRAKPSAKGRPSTTPSDTMYVFYRQSLPRASPLGPQQRLFNRFCNFFLKSFAERPVTWRSAKTVFAECQGWHSAN